MRILNFGSLTIDKGYSVDHFVRAGETILCTDMNIFCGGKGLNQSVALARAGAEVYHAGAIGTDGEMLREQLAASGAHLDYLQTLDMPSGLERALDGGLHRLRTGAFRCGRHDAGAK